MVRNSLFVVLMALLVFAFSLIIKRHHHVTRPGHCLYDVKRSLSFQNRGATYNRHYHPQCTLYGRHYLRQQCNQRTHVCWCVTRDGKKIAGTEAPEGNQPSACHLGPVKQWFRKIQE